MWAMEYNPNTFLLYETSAAAETTANVSEKLLKQYGKFERNNVRTGCKDYQSALAVFLAASILENKHKRILKEAKGLDDVVEVSSLPLSSPPPNSQPLFPQCSGVFDFS